MFKKTMIVSAAIVISLLAAIPAFAYTQEEIDKMTGPATGVANTIKADGRTGSVQPEHSEGLVNAVDNKDGTYTFEGKRYSVDYSWGEHCLTGYSATGNPTRSGKMPTVYHTVSGPKSMLGKVCLVQGSYMLNGSDNPVSTYDGIYVFEDTGGAAVETGIASTMNVPVVDIYMESQDAARAITARGSIVSNVFILKEIN